MASSKVLIAFSLASLALGQIIAPNALNLRIMTNRTADISPLLFGYMWEDINHSGDGGLYAEMLQNRAFQSVIPGTTAATNSWVPVNGAFISVTSKTPGVSSALPNSLQLDIPKTPVVGSIGVANEGFWGIKVQKEWTYKASFFAKSATFKGDMTVSLKSKTGTVFVSKTVSGISSNWKQFSLTLEPSASAPDTENLFAITVDGAEAQSSTIFLGMLSLFPPTFRGRPNGMRIDLAEQFAATKPSIFRFPGGNNVEGNSIAQRWKWNETIGPLETRPGRAADWGYPNTDGLGLMEYLDWIEDIGATPILGIWSGISTQNYSNLDSWQVVPEADLQPYIDDAINEIEFITGDAKTNKNAALRAKFGRQEPYTLNYVEIGNEDFFQVDSYTTYRWNHFVTQLSAKFPDIHFLSTTLPSTALNPVSHFIDFHMYASPDWFIFTGASMFDNYPRNGTQFFVGEYAVTSTNDTNALGTFAQGRLQYPSLQGAVAEAAFMIGMERNSDVVFAAAYAPTLQHLRSYQWTPDLISFDAGTVIPSVSYYVQQLFSLNRGTQVLATSPSGATNATDPLYWVATHNNETNIVFLKMANTGTTDLVADLSFDFDVGEIATTSQILQTDGSGTFTGQNTPENPQAFIPVHSSFPIPNSRAFNMTFPAMSLTIMAFPVKSL